MPQLTQHASRRPTTLRASLVLALGCLTLVASGARAEKTLDAELQALVDLPDPAARRVRADELAKRKDLDLGSLRTAMSRFAHKGGARTGTYTRDAQLFVPRRKAKGHARLAATIPLYVPTGNAPARPTPLILALHGAGGRGVNQLGLWRDVAEATGMIVAAPDEPGPNEGYAFTARERDAALAALRWVRRRFNVDENRIHLAGVSRGGHMTWDLGGRFPDRWASLAPMIGGPRFDTRRGQNNLRYIANVAHLPIRCLQGAKDQPGLIFNVKLGFDRLKQAGAPDAQLHLFPALGHSFRFEAVDWPTFLPATKRDPIPDRVVRRSATPTETRAAWVEILRLDRSVKESFMPRVVAAQWNGLDNDGKKRYIADAADKRTAQLVAERTGPGNFKIRSKGVRGLRLLLAPEMIREGEPVAVNWNGRVRKKPVRLSKRVLLREFAERFDRTFLPVAEVRLP